MLVHLGPNTACKRNRRNPFMLKVSKLHPLQSKQTAPETPLWKGSPERFLLVKGRTGWLY